MQFVDLAAQQKRLDPDLRARIDAVLAHGRYIMGPEIAELEAQLSSRVGGGPCITCASGTDALLMALLAAGIGPGDAVLTTPFTFMATAEVISLAGATPVFVDVCPGTYNLDPEALASQLAELAAGRSPAPGIPGGLRPRAVIPVDLYGLPADYTRIAAIAAGHDLLVIEDAAQSFGAAQDGTPVGALAPVAATSFFPAKPLGCYGDGGAVFTDREDLADVLRSLRVHGKGDHKYHIVRVGLNSRLDTLQAAILLSKLTVFDDEISARQRLADRYTELLAGAVRTPTVPAGRTSAWAQYAIMLPDRDAVAAALKAQGIPTAIYYPIPLHLQPVSRHLGYQPGSLPVSERLAGEVLCLPMHPYLTDDDQQRVTAAVVQAVQETAT
ncbi:aminotransferase class I/II-fold pyridoxal phosphate-dependent enzyme [bacterium]|nr:aminotransferase class I/II-fold pyridoxal phosphate-dependent enzyme [bacterium]